MAMQPSGQVTDYKRELDGGWDERGKLPGVFFFYGMPCPRIATR
jgi:hypothetical protein